MHEEVVEWTTHVDSLPRVTERRRVNREERRLSNAAHNVLDYNKGYEALYIDLQNYAETLNGESIKLDIESTKFFQRNLIKRWYHNYSLTRR